MRVIASSGRSNDDMGNRNPLVLPLCAGVILPTTWDYLQSLGVAPTDKWLYGLTLSAMSISNMFAGPLLGGVFDRTHQTKLLVMIALLFEIGGEEEEEEEEEEEVVVAVGVIEKIREGEVVGGEEEEE